MEKEIEAIYEKGVLKPLKSLKLREGEKVKIKIEKSLIEVIKKYQKKFKIKEEDIETFLRERR